MCLLISGSRVRRSAGESVPTVTITPEPPGAGETIPTPASGQQPNRFTQGETTSVPVSPSESVASSLISYFVPEQW